MAEGRLGLVAGSGVDPADLVPPGTLPKNDADPPAVPVWEAEGLAVVARHGSGVPAHLVDHAANLRVLVEQGVDRVLALASTGSLRADWGVGTVVVPDDFFAPWVTPSVFDDMRGHSVPGFAAGWRAQVVDSWRAHAERPVVDGGVYVHATGPRFETPAEIRFFATVGDVIGMTVAAECVLAAELGLRYAVVCVVDNLANGIGAGPLSREEFEQGVAANRASVTADVRAVARALVAAGGAAT